VAAALGNPATRLDARPFGHRKPRIISLIERPLPPGNGLNCPEWNYHTLPAPRRHADLVDVPGVGSNRVVGVAPRLTVLPVRGVRCGYSAVVPADAWPAPVVLGSWPTPLEPAPRLAAAVGLAADALWVKRDDLSGLGGGGNKVRKLQYTCAQALAAGATTVITSGAPQSNHARLTAAAAARLGLRSVLVLQGEEPEVPAGNLVLDLLAGARLVWTGPATAEQTRREVERQAEKVRQDGGIPHVIPYGGSNSYAAQGYVDCSGELLAQLPGLDHVIVAFGSGATMAGLVAGLGAERVIGIDTGAVADPCARLNELLDGMPDVRVRRADLQLDDGQVGAGYAAVTPAVREAMRLAARTEGIFLDPTYTARALAGLIARVAGGGIKRQDRTVFMHTGGLPGLFGHPDFHA
jgi:L-cysteate sulfo-lyase